MGELLTLWDVQEAQCEVIENMTAQEARVCVDEIKAGIANIGRRLLDLKERRGWEALGYSNWRECAQVEFGYKQSHVYRLLEAAEVERNISPIGEITIPESHLRPLAPLEPDQQRYAWEVAIETAPDGRVTADHVKSVVDGLRNGYQTIENGVKKCNKCGQLWAADLPYCPYCNISREARIAFVQQERDKPHVSHNSGNNEWYTPVEYIEAARAVMGEIELDPASSEIANRTVKARVYFTAEDDGLRYHWDGRVWMNPPYAGELIGKFADKLAQHFVSGDVSEAIVLVNNATETTWFQTMLACASAVCFIRRRVKFIDIEGNPSGAPLQGQAILYLGDNPKLFTDMFGEFGAILYGSGTGRNS